MSRTGEKTEMLEAGIASPTTEAMKKKSVNGNDVWQNHRRREVQTHTL